MGQESAETVPQESVEIVPQVTADIVPQTSTEIGPQCPEFHNQMQDVISMPLDFSGLQSVLCGDHFDVVDSYAEPNYSYFEPTSVVSNCDIMDQLKKMDNFMTSFKEEVFRRLSTLESSKAQTPSTPSNIAIQRRQN